MCCLVAPNNTICAEFILKNLLKSFAELFQKRPFYLCNYPDKSQFTNQRKKRIFEDPLLFFCFSHNAIGDYFDYIVDALRAIVIEPLHNDGGNARKVEFHNVRTLVFGKFKS